MTPIRTSFEPVFVTPMCQVVRSVIWGEPIFFTVCNKKDVIQEYHLRGGFYELEELEIIRRHCAAGQVFCDIGSNVGNHSIFALKFLDVAKVILFEPNPAAVEILLSNLSLNGVMGRCDVSHLGYGLSDARATGLSMLGNDRNLGGARMVSGGGDLEVICGDDALAGQKVDFIKIDVEGMEIMVLAGLSQTIAENRPTIFIEVDRLNYAAFDAWVMENDYDIVDRFKRYPRNENFLLKPKPASAANGNLDLGNETP